tara:strand:+ start:459 stop:905 length:447 start_codon:yes stop_codon:yes gene_type:complete
MSLGEFLKKQKVSKIYCYHEIQAEPLKVEYGWIESSELDVSKPIVLSYASTSKKTTEEDRDWSKREGRTAASLECYQKYFSSLTNVTPLEFIEIWEDETDDLEGFAKTNNENYREGEGLFLLNIADLIVNHRKFSQFGRIYKVVNSDA